MFYNVQSSGRTLAVELTVREYVSPGIEYGQCNFLDGKEGSKALQSKLYDLFFEEINLFHKKITMHL